MGVDGLIKFLQPIIKKQHLSSFRNRTAAIDMSSWIYRACYNASEQMHSEPQSIAFLFYIHQLIDLLQYYSIKMICVFDGRHLVHKQETVNKRKSDRESNQKKGEELIQKGQEQEGKKYIQRVIKVDERIITTTMRALKGRNIQFIVSPYESDCQMAKLFNLKLVDFAICEDSDLIIYGVPVVLKLSNEGECDYFNINEVRPENVENVYIRQFIQLDKTRRTEVAVLTGTDYLPSIKGIGIKKALKYVTETNSLSEAIERICQTERFKAQKPENYEQKSEQALLIFLLATSYNPDFQSLEFLTSNLNNFMSSTRTIKELQKLAGSNYGYDEAVSKGEKNIYTLQPRQLIPIPHDGKMVLNLDGVKDKELSFQNARLIRNRVRTRSSLRIEEEQIKQAELQAMCETRLMTRKKSSLKLLKGQSLKSLKGSLQQLCQGELNDLKKSIPRSKSKQEQFKDKFPSWMRYCPQQKKSGSFPASQ